MADSNGARDHTKAASVLRRLGRGEAKQGSAALVQSHANYPAFVALCPDRRRRQAMLRAFFDMTVRDGITHGEVWAVLDGDTVLGIAVWAPPDMAAWSNRRKLAAVPALIRIAAASPKTFRRFIRYGANAEHARSTDRHWYLIAAGVRPSKQRQGIGRRVLAPVLDCAERNALPCHLETSDPANATFYQLIGFAIVDHRVQLLPNGPPHIAMRRPAHPMLHRVLDSESER